MQHLSELKKKGNFQLKSPETRIEKSKLCGARSLVVIVKKCLSWKPKCNKRAPKGKETDTDGQDKNRRQKHEEGMAWGGAQVRYFYLADPPLGWFSVAYAWCKSLPRESSFCSFVENLIWYKNYSSSSSLTVMCNKAILKHWSWINTIFSFLFWVRSLGPIWFSFHLINSNSSVLLTIS